MVRMQWLGAMALVALAGCQTLPKADAEANPDIAVEGASGKALTLLPAPREVEVSGRFRPAPGAGVSAAWPSVSDNVRRAFEEALEETASGPMPTLRSIAIDPARAPHLEGYELTVQPSRGESGGLIEVVGHDEAGLFYAAQTLKQIRREYERSGYLPVCQIVDWPDFPNRGVMIDVARCKVPEMKTLYELVDLLVSWKCNQIQLYTEHSFAYRGHHTVWEEASPMTAEQARDLDAYCRERFVQLVPNQNSFGHMGRWLAHPEYADLAETPAGSDLCPVDPRSIELLRSMYDHLLPNFTSPYFNVGCDETWSLGQGRSKEACEARGVGVVYLEFLKKIENLVAQHGKSTMFWADIINNHPDLIPQLPEDSVAMEWGYEADHPFAEHGKRFMDNGVQFYVVPGTSSWNSLLGRTDNALANLRNAAENGKACGGLGFLVTDWGDGGHWQFLPVSYLPYAYGAALSWCVDANKDIDIARAVDAHAFRDEAGVMGRFAYDIGNAYKKTGVEFGNNTVFYMLLQHGLERPLADAGLGALKAEDLEATIAYIDETLARLDEARMDRPDADLIKAEYRMDAAMAKLACRLGLARLRAEGVPTSALPLDARLALAAELEPLIPEFRQLWLARNRSGGLKESAGILENLLTMLKRPAA